MNTQLHPIDLEDEEDFFDYDSVPLTAEQRLRMAEEAERELASIWPALAPHVLEALEDFKQARISMNELSRRAMAPYRH